MIVALLGELHTFVEVLERRLLLYEDGVQRPERPQLDPPGTRPRRSPPSLTINFGAMSAPDRRSTESPEAARRRELRAAVDVMFEALSHIQASVESSSPEEREASYRTFKEALYERFEHAVERRREKAPCPQSEVASGPDNSGEAAGPSGVDESMPAGGDGAVGAAAGGGDQDTRRTLWPGAET